MREGRLRPHSDLPGQVSVRPQPTLAHGTFPLIGTKRSTIAHRKHTYPRGSHTLYTVAIPTGQQLLPHIINLAPFIPVWKVV